MVAATDLNVASALATLLCPDAAGYQLPEVVEVEEAEEKTAAALHEVPQQPVRPET